MSPTKSHHARVIDFWRAVELFSPQDVPAASPRRHVWTIPPGGPLPWEIGHPLQNIALENGMTWRHTLYGGVYSLDRVHDLLVRTFGDDPQSFENRRRGESALFAVSVTDEGRPLLGTEVFSSCAWACGRTASPGPGTARWLEGFEASADECEAAFEGFVAASEDDERARELKKLGHLVGRPIDADDVWTVLADVVGVFDVAKVLDPREVRVASVQVSRRREFTTDSSDFLNSFIATDLARVCSAVDAGAYGPALRAYLGGGRAGDRVDVRTALPTTLVRTAPSMIPAGQWPRPADRPLALSQQFAVNAITADLTPSAGLFAVNGPPGTGKTTMLRDLIAATVVERARRLAELNRSADAFTTVHRWMSGEYQRTISAWRAELTGFEMVVASANNGAVENVTLEIPAQDSVTPWQHDIDHYAELATALLNIRSTEASPATPKQAWGLIAARLGNKKNREDFRDVFWFTDKQRKRRGIQDILKECVPSPTVWTEAVRAFRRADDQVKTLQRQREQVFRALGEVPGLAAEIEEERGRAEAAEHRVRSVRVRLGQAQEAVTAAEREAAGREARRLKHRDFRPGFVTALFSLGKAVREWRAEDHDLALGVQEAEQSLHDARTRLRGVQREEREFANRLDQHRHRLEDLRRRHDQLTSITAEAAERWGTAVPTGDWWTDERRRELTAPWTDAEWSDARVRLFIEALRLHRAFLEAEPERMRKNLHAAMDILQGTVPHDAPPAGVEAAWQSLFFVIPVISTTFASVSRLFSHLGRESVGWLFIDEAGQATPQSAVGAIWRAKRVVVVGDPLQLEPVVTLPFTAQQALRRTFAVEETWLPGKTSVQRLADQSNRFGTFLPDGDDQVWVGAPLRVHRRCLDPMFTIANTIAYDGMMIHATPEPANPLDQAPPSKWLHVPATESDGHWIPAEGAELRKVLSALRDRCGINPDQVFVIAPFRDIADQIQRLKRQFPGLRGGTIHTAQGKEADVVVLVLGGDPAKPGAKSWAASKPNLVNVAASRARQRLYVIGDHSAWSSRPYFTTLAQHLPHNA